MVLGIGTRPSEVENEVKSKAVAPRGVKGGQCSENDDLTQC